LLPTWSVVAEFWGNWAVEAAELQILLSGRVVLEALV
jgi:hypothetical protein